MKTGLAVTLVVVLVLLLVAATTVPYRSESIFFAHDDATLAGDLWLPDSRAQAVPVVVIVHGDGAVGAC